MDLFNLGVNDLDKTIDNLNQFHMKFISNFRTKTRSVEQHSLKYLQGIFLEQGRGNMVKYAKKLPDTDNQALQHFISNSPWDEKPVIKMLGLEWIVFMDNSHGCLRISIRRE